MPNPLPLSKLAETSTKITLGWTPVPEYGDLSGYVNVSHWDAGNVL